MKKRRAVTSDALEILHKRHYAGRPERSMALEKARANDEPGRDARKREPPPLADDILDLQDLDRKSLTPKEGTITDESIIRAIRADRDAQ